MNNGKPPAMSDRLPKFDNSGINIIKGHLEEAIDTKNVVTPPQAGIQKL